MNPLLRRTLEVALKVWRRLKERTGLVSGFADMEMHLWMLAVQTRTEAFERAIRKAVRPGDVDLPERADVVVSETIGAFVFSEEILATLADARARFLKPGGVVIPDRILVSIGPVESYREGTGYSGERAPHSTSRGD